MLLCLGFKKIFSTGEGLWCTQHLEKNDLEKLKCHCSNASDHQRMMADIYGSQKKVLLQEGLVLMRPTVLTSKRNSQVPSLFGMG